MSRNDEGYLEKLAIAEGRARSRSAPQPSSGKSPAKAPDIVLDPSPGTRSVTEIAARIDRVAEQSDEAEREISAVRRGMRKAEQTALAAVRAATRGEVADVGSGGTIIKRSDSPVMRLLSSGAIGPEELRSSEDICLAFQALAGALFLKPVCLERRDRSNSIHEPVGVIDAVSRYQAWAKIWSVRAKKGDPTLGVVVAAVWDERPFRVIEQDLNIRNGTAAKATAAGLRDYAARAGWAQGAATHRWLVSEGAVFRLRTPRKRVARAA